MSRGKKRISVKRAGHCSQVEDLAKADGLDLGQPQGALAAGQRGLGNNLVNRTGLVRGPLTSGYPDTLSY